MVRTCELGARERNGVAESLMWILRSNMSSWFVLFFHEVLLPSLDVCPYTRFSCEK